MVRICYYSFTYYFCFNFLCYFSSYVYTYMLFLIFTSKATETSFLVVFTDVRLVVPSHCCSKVSWSPDRTFPNLQFQGEHYYKNLICTITNTGLLQLCYSHRG